MIHWSDKKGTMMLWGILSISTVSVDARPIETQASRLVDCTLLGSTTGRSGYVDILTSLKEGDSYGAQAAIA